RDDAAGADELHFYNITASSDDRETMIDIIRATARQVFIPLTVGGGVPTTDDIARLLRVGAEKVSVNSAAVTNPQLIADGSRRFGAQAIVLSMDVKRRPDGAFWEVVTHGGRRHTGMDALEWAK